MKTRLCILSATLLMVCAPLLVNAQPTNIRTYTQEAPLVYEDVWDLWPYSFLNENGEPDGFNIDLIRMVLGELKIPYVIKMKPSQEAFNDLRDGKSDLMMGLAVGFHDEYGHYSQNAVTLFTQSVASPKNDPVTIHSFKDLSNHRVIVNDSSLCHHLMLDYGWGENAIPYSDIKEAIFHINEQDEGQIVWNDLSLKWLIKQYHLDKLEVNPVNMPHGEYKFMSNDLQLLARLDSVYSVLDSTDKLTSLRTKWFYPDRHETGIPSWTWYIVGAIVLLALIMAINTAIYRMQANRITIRNEQKNKRIAQIMATSHVRIWTYDVEQKQFTWRGENGLAAYTYTVEEFSQRYRPADFERLTDVLRQLADTPQSPDGKEEEVRLNIKARDTEGGDTEEKDFTIVLSVLHRDKKGRTTVILGIKQDVTEQTQRARKADESIQRYWSIFNMPMLGIVRFNPEGILVNANEKFCRMFDFDREALLAQHISFKDFLGAKKVKFEEADGFSSTKTYHVGEGDRELNVEIYCMTFTDDHGKPEGLLVTFHDITTRTRKQEEKAQLATQIDTAKEELAQYFSKIDALLRDGRIRMASYSPTSHTLTIFSGTNQVQHALTQTRCMTLVDDSMQKKAMHIINDMDSLSDKEIRFDICTNIRPSGIYPLHLLFSFIPVRDKNQQVTEYFGLCQDITRQKSIEHQLKQEAKKVQEVENTKTSFVNNMVEEIRTPMSTIVTSSKDLHEQQDPQSNETLCQDILDNSKHLLHLIDNILYLSRLEAHMIELEQKPTNFADTFDTYCGADKQVNPKVRFITENPYEQLVLNIDGPKLGNVMERVIENAHQHTQEGFIRVRYDYIGRRLMISVEDTGEGIAPKALEHLNGQTSDTARSSSGLGIPICKELLAQMGGTLEINSEQGLGTTAWITLPCHASTVKRKKLV